MTTAEPNSDEDGNATTTLQITADSVIGEAKLNINKIERTKKPKHTAPNSGEEKAEAEQQQHELTFPFYAPAAICLIFILSLVCALAFPLPLSVFDLSRFAMISICCLFRTESVHSTNFPVREGKIITS